MRHNRLYAFLLLVFLVSSPGLYAYNYDWTTKEDIATSNPPEEEPEV